MHNIWLAIGLGFPNPQLEWHYKYIQRRKKANILFLQILSKISLFWKITFQVLRFCRKMIFQQILFHSVILMSLMTNYSQFHWTFLAKGNSEDQYWGLYFFILYTRFTANCYLDEEDEVYSKAKTESKAVKLTYYAVHDCLAILVNRGATLLTNEHLLGTQPCLLRLKLILLQVWTQ